VIVAAPDPTPVTNPLGLTVATVGLSLAHVTTRPDNTPPAESRDVALSCRVPPTGRLPDAGVTATAATGSGLRPTLSTARQPNEAHAAATAAEGIRDTRKFASDRDGTTHILPRQATSRTYGECCVPTLWALTAETQKRRTVSDRVSPSEADPR